MKKLLLILPILVLLGAGCSTDNQVVQEQTANPPQPVVQYESSSVPAKHISIDFSEKLQEYSANIVTAANSSVCIWNYTAGNGSIPWQQVTKADKLHTLNVPDGVAFSDLKILCRDDSDIVYWGDYK